MSIIATDFKNAILNINTKFKTGNEMRIPEYGALKAVMGDTSRLLPASEIERAKNSVRQDVELAVLKKFTLTNVDADTCSPSGETSDSAIVTPSYSNYGFAIKANPEIHYGNKIGYQEQLAFDMFQGWKTVYGRLDTASVALMEASKHALTGQTSKYFDITTGQATYSGQAERLYGYIPAFMKKLNLAGPYIEVANTEALTPQLLAAAYGVNNSQNINGFRGGLAGSDNFTTYTTNNINPGDDLEVRYVFEPGTFGMLNWNRQIGKENMKISDAEYWTTVADPWFGQTWTVHYKKQCEDLSGTYEGLTATIGEHWLIYSSFAFLESYSSDTTQSVVKIVTQSM